MTGQGSRVDRVVTAVGWWMPELLAAGLATAGAVWLTPWLWLGTAAVAAWVAAHPRLRHHLARATGRRRAARRARLTTAPDDEDDTRDDTDRPERREAAG